MGLSALHDALVMVKNRLDNSVADGLSHDLLSLLQTLEGQLLLHVCEGDLGVGDVEFLQPKLQHCVAQSQDQSESLVLLERLLVLAQDLLEQLHVSLLHASYNGVVGSQGSFVVCLREELPVRNLTHQQLNQEQQFLNMNSESSSSNLRSLSEGLNESCLRL